ncbi:MAG: GDSL-type esterase/lipase family protein [Pirellulales bacterium]
MSAEPRVISKAPAAADLPGENRGPAVSRRWVWGYLAVALPALVLAGDAALAFARGWQPRFRIDALVLIGVAAWLAGVTAPLVLPAGRRFYARCGAKLIALAASVCFAWLVGEWAVGAALAHIGDPFHCWRPGITMVHRPNPQILRGVGPEATANYNDWGVRGTNPPARREAYRILCVGGSSTACTYLDDAKSWPQLLATRLHGDDPAHEYWVGNIGIPGFRMREHLRFVEQSPLVDELDCLVVQAGMNDFMTCLLGPQPAPPVWTHSNVRQLARTLASRITAVDTLVEDTGGTVYSRRRAVRQAARIDNAEPDLTDGLDRFERELNELVDAARGRNVRLVLATQPALWRPDLDAENAALLWFGQMGDGRFLSVGQLRAGMDRFNQLLRRVCRQRGAELVDLSELDGDPAMFYDDCHFTELGAERVARDIADWFVLHPAYPPKETAR